MLVIALLFIVAVGFCQEPIVLNTNSSTVGKYNKPTKKWVYDKAVKTEMTIKVYDDYIRIYDQAHSIYRIIEEKEVDDEEVLYNARCLDEKNTSCFYTLIKTKSDDQYYVMIMYPNKILYVYRVN
jgi:hypothetical protein